MSANHLIFVYGTLRPSLRKVHDRYPSLGWGTPIGEGTIDGTLFKLTGTVPGVILGTGNKVVGEVVEVGDELFKQFDWLEGHPHNYCRKKVEVRMANGSIAMAWCYEYPKFDLSEHTNRVVKSGDWTKPYLKAIGYES